MAIRRHVIAARNTNPAEMAAALAPLKVSEIEEANGWCWAMASVWFTNAHDLLEAIKDFEGPCLLTTTEDACRWWLHLRGRGQAPCDTVHEFAWIGRGAASPPIDDDLEDFYDDDRVDVQMVEYPSFPAVPKSRLQPLDFDDEYFEPYDDDDDEDEDEDGYDDGPRSPLEELVRSYEESGISLPAAIVEPLQSIEGDALHTSFLALHGAWVAGELERFGIAHDRDELLRILTGESVTAAEMEGDVGNLWRFLDHLGLGPKFAAAIQEPPPEEAPRPAEVPGARVVKAAGKLPLHEVRGGPGRVPLDEALLMARVTYYQDTYPEYVIRVRLNTTESWPDGKVPSYATVTPAKKEAGVDLSFQGMDVPIYPKARRRLGALLATLPDGARLELLAKGAYAKTRLTGVVEGGEWRVTSTSSPLAAEDFAWMLDVFRAAESRGPHIARDEAEAEAILDDAAHHMLLCDDPPRRDGLQLRSTARSEAEALGALFFRRRLAGAWDFSRIERHVATKFKEWRKFMEQMARENALPATDVVVFAGESSRFLEADYKARSMDSGMRAKAKEFRAIDKEMASLGYTCLGAVVCERVGGGILRCYANAAERTYSTSYVLPFGQVWHDYCTRFGDGTSLTTGNGLVEGSFRSLRLLMRACPGVSVRALHAEHRAGIERLATRGLAPVEIDASLEGVCRTMDEFLTRRLGAGVET